MHSSQSGDAAHVKCGSARSWVHPFLAGAPHSRLARFLRAQRERRASSVARRLGPAESRRLIARRAAVGRGYSTDPPLPGQPNAAEISPFDTAESNPQRPRSPSITPAMLASVSQHTTVRLFPYYSSITDVFLSLALALATPIPACRGASLLVAGAAHSSFSRCSSSLISLLMASMRRVKCCCCFSRHSFFTDMRFNWPSLRSAAEVRSPVGSGRVTRSVFRSPSHVRAGTAESAWTARDFLFLNTV